MTTLVARPPLHILSSSMMQSGSRRLSARLQEKDNTNHRHAEGVPGNGGRSNHAAASNKKRKHAHEEEDDGFVFARVKKTKQAPPPSTMAATTISATTSRSAQNAVAAPEKQHKSAQTAQERPVVAKTANTATSSEMPKPDKKRRNKLSFSTPAPKVHNTQTRRSKRLSNEASSPVDNSVLLNPRTRPREEVEAKAQRPQTPKTDNTQAGNEDAPGERAYGEPEAEDSSSTKIALPFADTPVMRRNKAMREGKNTKGKRRSSLGLRGRRASSLIDTSSSNALPHQEVKADEFYKHIESDLVEPRRMRQLLIWCATRAIHAKPQGTDFEDASAKSAARIIEEELLKEIADKAELSSWYNREDVPVTTEPLPERLNPRNTQNTAKIAELESQIQRLKAEKEALKSLLKPPAIAQVEDRLFEEAHDVAPINKSLLSDEDAGILAALETYGNTANDMSHRLHSLHTSIGPTVDAFADGLHRVGQYQTAADNVAGRVLSICAEKLAEKERQGRKKALQDDRSPGRDLSNVLRVLSRTDR